mgnify:CR=1 FL=1
MIAYFFFYIANKNFNAGIYHARNGNLFTHEGAISIKRKEYEFDFNPIDSQCKCKVCRQYTRAYLRHLFRTKEILYSMLATYHNLAFLYSMVQDIRDAIQNDSFNDYYKNFLKKYENRLE